MKTPLTLQQANAAATARQIAYFRAIPWCAALLSPPDLVIDQSVSRRLTNTTRDVLISRTLNSPEGIPAYITFYRRPSSTKPPASEPKPPLSSKPASSSDSSSGDQGEGNLINQISSLISLGPGLNGWEGICHGGIVVTLLDEVMGQVFAANRAHGLLKPAEVPIMTGYLNTQFKKPVRTGSVERGNVVLVTARLVRREGRKFWMEGEVRGEEGGVLARAEALFVMLRGKL